MQLERVEVLEFVDPSSFVTRDAVSKEVKENRAIYNCLPVQSGNWQDSTKTMLRHWLTLAQDQVWFCQVRNNEGLLFFRDPKQRIINVKTMLVDLFLAQKHSFVYQKMERRQLEELMSVWAELHELKIDYAEFRDPKTTSDVVPVDDIPKEPEPMIMHFDENSYKYYPGPDPVFIYGKVHPAPIQSIPFAHLLKDMMSIKNLTFPKHVWSKIIGGGSAIVIPPSNDRNYIFEPVLFHNVQQKISKSHVQRGPIAVVLCDTRDTAASVGNYFITFNAGLTAQVRVNSLTNAHEMEEEEIYNTINCDILIVTLSSMLALLFTKINGYGLFSVQILVVQNAHNMATTEGCVRLEEAQPWVNFWEVLQFFKPQKKQTIVVTRAWMPVFKKVFASMNEPIICIGSPLEVALKENPEMDLKMAYNEEGQIANLIEIVNQALMNKQCTAVVFKNAEAMTSTQRELERLNIPFYALGDTPHRPTSLYLMTEKSIHDMLVDQVDVLVHFSMPKWAFFDMRFVLLARNIENKLPTKICILLSLTDSDKFLGAMETLSARTQSRVFDVCRELKRRKDQYPENLLRQFCPTLALHGDCPAKFTCNDRHSLNESDVPAAWLPVEQQVEFRVVLVKAPNHFRAEIVPAKGESMTVTRDRLRLKLSLDLLFADEANRKTKTEFSVGELCLFHVGQYRRGRIIAINVRHRRLTVQCLETGNEFPLCTNIDTIYQLPENLQAIPPQVIDIYLAGILPIDADSGWSTDSLRELKIKMDNCKGSKFVGAGKIGVTMNNVIYLTEMKVHELLATSGARIISLDVKEYLLQCNFAKPWEKGIRGLLKIARDFDLKSKMQVTPKEDKPVDAPIDQPVKLPNTEESEDAVVASAVKIPKQALLTGGEITEVNEQQQELYELTSEGEEEIMWVDDNDETFQYKKPDYVDDSDIDFNFDDDELRDLCLMMFNMPGPAVDQFPAANIEEIVEEEEEEVAPGDAPVVVVKQDPQPLPRPLWQSEFKSPEILWSQSDDEIKLRVSAPDVLHYEMKVGPEDLHLVLEFPELRRAMLNFFGTIDHAGATAVMRGLVLIITLPKLLPGSKFNWTRLLLTKQHFRWLKYYDNFTGVDDVELNEDSIDENPVRERDFTADIIGTIDMNEFS